MAETAISPNWEAIKAFYAERESDIMRSANEWGFPPYEWEEVAGITMSPIEACMWSDIRIGSHRNKPRRASHGS